MLLVLVAIRVVPATVVVRPLRGRASFDSCWEDLVAPGEHLAVCGPLGCLSIVGGRDSRFDNSPLPYRTPRLVDHRRRPGRCHYGGSCCPDGSRNPADSLHRACNHLRGGSHLPSRCRGRTSGRSLCSLVGCLSELGPVVVRYPVLARCSF